MCLSEHIFLNIIHRLVCVMTTNCVLFEVGNKSFICNFVRGRSEKCWYRILPIPNLKLRNIKWLYLLLGGFTFKTCHIANGGRFIAINCTLLHFIQMIGTSGLLKFFLYIFIRLLWIIKKLTRFDSYEIDVHRFY
jgi:hypothetical protein